MKAQSQFTITDLNDGNGIKSTEITYQASESGTTAPTGDWTTTIPVVAANQYLWTRTVITYDDGSTSTSYSVGALGEDAYEITLSDELIQIPTDSTYKPFEAKTYTCSIEVYKGVTRLQYPEDYSLSINSASTTPGACVISQSTLNIATTSSDNVLGTGTVSGSTLNLSTQSAPSGDLDAALAESAISITVDNSAALTTNAGVIVVDVIIGEIVRKKYIKWIAQKDGASAVTFSVYSEDGFVFTQDSSTSKTLCVFAYEGTTQIANATYQWSKLIDNQWKDNWTVDDANAAVVTNESSLTVYASEVLNSQIYRCVMNYSEKDYTYIVTITDTSDTYMSDIIPIGGSTIKRGQSGVIIYARVFRKGIEVDSLAAPIHTTSNYPNESGIYYKLNINNTISLQQYNPGEGWTDSSENTEYAYNYKWALIDSSGIATTITQTNKVIFISNVDITEYGTVQCTISDKSGNPISVCQETFSDINDAIISETQPNQPYDGQIWIDTSKSPYKIKIWKAGEDEVGQWLLASDTGTNVFTAQPKDPLPDGFCYKIGDMWVVGDDYSPTYAEDKTYPEKTVLVCLYTADKYNDHDWGDIVSANPNYNQTKDEVEKLRQHVVVSGDGLFLFGADENKNRSRFYSQLTNGALNFCEIPEGKEIDNNYPYGEQDRVTWISNKELHAKTTIIEGSLEVTYSTDKNSDGNTNYINPCVQLATGPIGGLKLGNIYKLQIESNGSLSLVGSQIDLDI